MKTIFLSLLAAGASVALSAATSTIGTVRSVGDFRVDGSVVRSNSTIFDGDVIETAASRSVVQLSSVQLTLAPESRAKIFSDRTVLEKGTGMLRESSGHVFEADSLRIAPAAKDAVVQVDVKTTSRISVYAFAGGAQVRNSSGLLIASLNPGMALEFDAPGQAGGSTAVTITGMVTTKDGIFFMKDATTNVIAQIKGKDKDLAKLVGKRTEVTGSLIPDATPVAPATEVIAMVKARILGGALPAGAATAGAAGAAGAAVGLSIGALVAIIGGVAVAGTVGGLAAAGTFHSSSASPQ
jgi:hypothetical protein